MDSPEEILETVASFDKEISSRARKFALRIMDEAEELLDYANPEMKLSMLRTWMPALARGLAKQEQISDEMAKLQEAQRALYDQVHGLITAHEQPDITASQ